MTAAGKHKGNLSERLPGHKPNRDLWGGIAGSLESVPAKPLSERLPLRSPVNSLWTAIAKGLPHPWYSFRSIYFRSALAVLLIFLLIFLFPEFTRVNIDNGSAFNKIIVEEQITDEGSQKVKSLSVPATEPTRHEQGNPKQVNTKIDEPVQIIQNVSTKLTAQETSQEILKSNPVVDESGSLGDKPLITKNLMAEANGSEEEIILDDVEMNRQKSSAVSDELVLLKLPAISAEEKMTSHGFLKSAKSPLAFSGSGNQYKSYQRDISYELGFFVQPSFIHNISSIEENWNYSPSLGFSMAMINKKFILETGLSYMQLEFEDKVEIDYYAFVFLGTVLNSENYEVENYLNDQGDTLERRIYSVELIDVYDSTLVEEEKNDLVKLSGITIPLTAGYRFSDNGRFCFDVKTGLDLMVITGRVIPGNPEPTENIKVVEVKNSLADKYSVRWKYHLALSGSYRAAERLSVYAEPSLWWYPEGIRNAQSNTMKNPFEAGMKIGLRWEF